MLRAFLALLPLVSMSIAASASVSSNARGGFDVSSRLGNLSPYRDAPVPAGMSADLPEDCTVDQVMLMHRHGSRYPLSSELEFITNLTAKLTNASAAVQKTRLPQGLQFLKEGYHSSLGHDDLTAPGRRQLFDHGVAFALKYPHLQATELLAGGQDRVIESAQWFANGYFGREWASLNATAFKTIAEDNVTISHITPVDTCKNWQYNYGNNLTIEWGSHYLPPIAKRLNKVLPTVGFTTADVHGSLYACAYDLAAHDVSPWCDAFTPSEIADFEYELDLLMVGAFGYNLPGNIGPLLGSLFVNKLVERFTNATGDARPVYLEFGHDTTIEMALTALGLAKDTPKLSAKGPVRSSRKWRTSYQVPFGAQMTWEKFSCASSFKGPQIRLVLNNAPFPLTTCERMDKKHGSCALDDFIAVNAASTNVTWGDAAWNATCGDAGF